MQQKIWFVLGALVLLATITPVFASVFQAKPVKTAQGSTVVTIGVGASIEVVPKLYCTSSLVNNFKCVDGFVYQEYKWCKSNTPNSDYGISWIPALPTKSC